jgi:hypothetical protein
MLTPEQRPITPDEMAALARRAFGSVLGDLIELAGTRNKAGARARSLLRDVSGAIASGGGATEKPEAVDGDVVSQQPPCPAT